MQDAAPQTERVAVTHQTPQIAVVSPAPPERGEGKVGDEPAEFPSTPPPLVWRNVPIESWKAESGDQLLIDIERNVGTIVHQNGEVLQFPVITGQKRTVIYIGLRYNAETPKKSWTALSLDTQGDRITYGKSGRFLRLYDRGSRTHYGIHAHRDETVMFGRDDRYQSMGCIIVQEAVLNILEETFDRNGGALPVRTYGSDVPMIASASVHTES